MKTKTIEDILFQVYELGVQQTDCDLTKKANTIMMLANQRVIEVLEDIAERAKPYRYMDKHQILLDTIWKLK